MSEYIDNQKIESQKDLYKNIPSSWARAFQYLETTLDRNLLSYLKLTSTLAMQFLTSSKGLNTGA